MKFRVGDWTGFEVMRDDSLEPLTFQGALCSYRRERAVARMALMGRQEEEEEEEEEVKD